MAIKFLADLNLSGAELQSAALETLANDPSSGNVTGQIYFNTGSDQVKIFNGSEYIVVGQTYSAGNGISQSGTVFSADANDGISVDSNGISVDSTVLRTSGAQTKAGNMTFSNNVTITGNLTVNGTQTILNTAELAVEDTNIELNSGASEGADSGISVFRGQGEDVPQLLWDESASRWTFTNNGSTFYNIPLSTEYNNYSLPTASSSVLGGVKIGSGISISSGVISADSQTANDFTDALLTKLNGIAAGADNYSSWTVSDGTNSETVASGATVAWRGSGATSVSYDASTNTFSISSTDNNTTYSTATATTAGLVKIGYTENGKNYPVELSSGKMFVNVPWTDTNTNTQRSDEEIRDLVADVMVGNPTHVGITASDDDGSNAVTLTNNHNVYVASISNHAGGDYDVTQATAGVRFPANIQMHDSNGRFVIPDILWDSSNSKWIFKGLPAGSYDFVIAGRRA